MFVGMVLKHCYWPAVVNVELLMGGRDVPQQGVLTAKVQQPAADVVDLDLEGPRRLAEGV